MVIFIVVDFFSWLIWPVKSVGLEKNELTSNSSKMRFMDINNKSGGCDFFIIKVTI